MAATRGRSSLPKEQTLKGDIIIDINDHVRLPIRSATFQLHFNLVSFLIDSHLILGRKGVVWLYVHGNWHNSFLASLFEHAPFN
jgi:hypothetical protein